VNLTLGGKCKVIHLKKILIKDYKLSINLNAMQFKSGKSIITDDTPLIELFPSKSNNSEIILEEAQVNSILI
jgi:hypothetical protein